tara:strand:+ start:528 stop:1463 length:936 start_codon:yes stop_codon:yes gene_type:complete
MKIIISRKGLDTGTAKKMRILNRNSFAPGCSPVYKDCMISLPISDSLEGNNSYDYLSYKGKKISSLYKELHGINTLENNLGAHADPDLIENFKIRENGWKPNFGQASGAQGQLEKQQISKGDLFLFFGLFSHVDINLNENPNNFLDIKTQSKPFHCFFGWLQTEQPLDAKYINNKPWLDDHPHRVHSKYKDLPKNRIYISTDFLSLDTKISGAGHFEKYNKNLRLSDPDEELVSSWILPKWFLDQHEKHRPEKLGCWTKVGDKASCSSHYKSFPKIQKNQVGQWQETVFDTKYFPEAEEWALKIIKSGVKH